MKIGRRGFLSLGLGASAGLTLSPLPWKLLDDLSIWTQNWPWVPIPKDGKETYQQSVCTLCPGGCGITVRKIDERVVAVAGREDFPINQGRLCPLGLSGPQLLYTPVRVMSPMLKVDKGYRQISWERAMSLLTSKLRDLRADGQPEKLACLADSDQGTTPGLLKRFLTAFGSPNFFQTVSADDAWEVLTEKLSGAQFIPGYDLEETDYVMSLGCGLVEGWGSPLRTMRAHSLWKERGTQLVQIESRLSGTSAAADRWIAVKPGTEADLALGICRVLVENGIENSQPFREILRSRYATEQVAKKTGVSPSIIESLADDFKHAKRPLALCGGGQGRSPVASREFIAATVLNILAGNIDQPGGVYRNKKYDYLKWPQTELDTRARNGLKQGRLNASPEDLFQTIADSQTSPIEMLLVSGVNPCYSCLDTENVIQAVQKIPFVVSFSSYWDETAVNADLVLPNHSHLERYQDVAVYGGLTEPKMGLSVPVSRQLFDTSYTGDVVLGAAKTLGGTISNSFPWKNYETCLKSTLSGQWQALIKQGFINLPQPGRTPDKGSLRLRLPKIDAKEIQLEGNIKEYPLILISKSSMRLSSGAAGSPPFMIKAVEDTVLKKNMGLVDIHPQTAGKMGLGEDETALLTTPRGAAEVMIHLDEGTMPGMVVISQGLGHTAYGAYLADKGVNFNQLMGPVKDPLTGQNTAWGINAKLSKV
ncbi:MAG: molybdopterin-dependent oxidoreductase [Deltaproteobacteria bacterium]|nr:molybdopterin-dependent oxidoreductase [Deltaproteobacteria bacterium]